MASRTTRSRSKATNEDTASIDKFTDRIWSNLESKRTWHPLSPIVQLEAQMNDLVTKQKSLEALCDQLEQYTRRTNIRIFGIPETNKQTNKQTNKRKLTNS